MEYKKIGNTVFARLDPGEEIHEQVKNIAQKENIRLADISGLGAVDELTIGVFHTGEKKYYSNHFTGSFEIVSLTGTITTLDGAYYPHFHLAVGDGEGHVYGGHLNQARVSATAELVIHVQEGCVERGFSDEIGLNLMKF